MGNDPSTAPREAKVGGEVHKGTVIRSASQVMPQMLVEHSHDNEQQSKTILSTPRTCKGLGVSDGVRSDQHSTRQEGRLNPKIEREVQHRSAALEAVVEIIHNLFWLLNTPAADYVVVSAGCNGRRGWSVAEGLFFLCCCSMTVS